MTDPDDAELRERCLRVRESIVRMCANPDGGHLGGSMSMVEILVTLYHRVLRIDPAEPTAPDRDLLILSKGHGAIGLYAALAERGFFPADWLDRYAAADEPLTAHPTRAVPGVEMPTGSLGHGLSVGAGFALDFRLTGSDRRCFVILGDGELQEGSNWEAAMAASAHRLDRLVAVVDRNRLQITGPTEDAVGLEPLADRWRSFGWEVVEVDGHDLTALHTALGEAPRVSGRPTVVIAHTVKGKGLPYIEGQTRSHYARLTGKPAKRALAVLGAHRRRTEQSA
ncbi:transketolase [Paractinoplanes toevensis]|uniref:Transketolase, N-terminal subunit n=1 Tax=Paractinoplanes toevensis TaxID=571911 RepID=A0A919WBH9_9ACTN|nr:transketolase [Actinoplanes toevensis]GIM97028.1 transketolase, N-terminal subunit [Actinoplanes toevensis]